MQLWQFHLKLIPYQGTTLLRFIHRNSIPLSIFNDQTHRDFDSTNKVNRLPIATQFIRQLSFLIPLPLNARDLYRIFTFQAFPAEEDWRSLAHGTNYLAHEPGQMSDYHRDLNMWWQQLFYPKDHNELYKWLLHSTKECINKLSAQDRAAYARQIKKRFHDDHVNLTQFYYGSSSRTVTIPDNIAHSLRYLDKLIAEYTPEPKVNKKKIATSPSGSEDFIPTLPKKVINKRKKSNKAIDYPKLFEI